VTFAGAYWNCGERLEKLLAYVRPWFGTIIAVVQESPDNTLEVARKYANVVVEDPWLGHGNPSIHKAVSLATTKFVFVVSDDEWPTEELLYSFQDLVGKLKEESKDGAWVHFTSTIDGLEFTKEQDGHLRFFRGGLNWPPTQHSRPMIDNTIFWTPPGAWVRHDRSLDEMMIDYLNRYDVGVRENISDQQMTHNRAMMRNGCIGVADKKGWEYVTSFEWWPKILEVAFEGQAPDMSKPVPPPVEPPKAAPKKRRKKPSK
jgi:hypothetical protein